MPRPKNEKFGECTCRRCGGVAEIRRLKNHEKGARYLHCDTCGPDRITSRNPLQQAALDAWIDEHEIKAAPVQEAGAEPGALAPEPEQSAPREAVPDPVKPAPAPAPSRDEPGRKSWIDSII